MVIFLSLAAIVAIVLAMLYVRAILQATVEAIALVVRVVIACATLGLSELQYSREDRLMWK